MNLFYQALMRPSHSWNFSGTLWVPSNLSFWDLNKKPATAAAAHRFRGVNNQHQMNPIDCANCSVAIIGDVVSSGTRRKQTIHVSNGLRRVQSAWRKQTEWWKTLENIFPTRTNLSQQLVSCIPSYWLSTAMHTDTNSIKLAMSCFQSWRCTRYIRRPIYHLIFQSNLSFSAIIKELFSEDSEHKSLLWNKNEN